MAAEDDPAAAHAAHPGRPRLGNEGQRARHGTCQRRYEAALRTNLRAHCVPESLLDGPVAEYGDFLQQRRTLMAKKN